MTDDTPPRKEASGSAADALAVARIAALEEGLRHIAEGRTGTTNVLSTSRRAPKTSREFAKAYEACRISVIRRADEFRGALEEIGGWLGPPTQTFISSIQHAGQALYALISGLSQRAGPQSADARSETAAPQDLAPKPLLWFYLGDVLDWLKMHDRVTGVGRVTCELFLASLAHETGQTFLPCVPAATPSGLAAVSYRGVLRNLGGKIGVHPFLAPFDASDPAPSEPIVSLYPSRGDHIVFTGVIWNRDYCALFQKLHDHEVDFSVLIHDIIPIERPDLVSETDRSAFTEWLQVTVRLARFVFVSSAYVRDQLLRWAVLSGHDIAWEIVVVPFGINAPAPIASAKDVAPSGLNQVELASFILSVGTIDRRKNQILLCHLWAKLAAEFGADLPQLVLVGRDDLGLATKDEFADLITAKKILILQGLPDAALARLYRACLFTVFPSLSEGYGLPVAESLAASKLCIASDLKAIRAHAGGLPWYFDPADPDALLRLLREAICSPEARAAAEQKIAVDYKGAKWESSFATMAKAIEAARQYASSPASSVRPVLAEGIAPADLAPALAAAGQWCVAKEPRVSILIVNRDDAALTYASIRHIFAHTRGIPYEIIVVDNGSSDANLRPLRELADVEGLRLLSLGCDRYFGEAINIGAEHAQGDYLCLLSPGTSPQKDWLNHLIACFESHSDIGGVGPLVLSPDGSARQTAGSLSLVGNPIPITDSKAAYLEAGLDYISAAAFILPRDLFLNLGGFDLNYEPAYYEDIDLCFKLLGAGKRLALCPEAVVIHGDAAVAKKAKSKAQASKSAAADRMRSAVEDLSRDKFMARWAVYLRTRNPADVPAATSNIRAGARGSRGETVDDTRDGASTRKTAIIFSPFALTPGGGERYILTFAWALTRSFSVTIATSHPYSRLRLHALADEFGLDLSQCALATRDELAGRGLADLMIAMGNHVVPPIDGFAAHNLYMCQFPFPIAREDLEAARPRLQHYDRIIVNSAYSQAHVFAGLNAHQLPPVPIEVLYPPVTRLDGTARAKKPIILSVGRFFEGGHNKRHDLLIEAFRRLAQQSGAELALHLVGSSIPLPEQMAYLAKLQRLAQGLDIVFHVNAPAQTLVDLYRDATVYWHATGLNVDLAAYPGAAEHFGMTIVEAMSAACVPLAFNCGGPREIIQHGKNGFLYNSLDELVARTADLFASDHAEMRIAMADAAQQRASDFSVETFTNHVGRLVQISDAV